MQMNYQQIGVRNLHTVLEADSVYATDCACAVCTVQQRIRDSHGAKQQSDIINRLSEL